MKMNKKATYVKFMHLVIWAIFLVFVLLVIVIFTAGFIKKEMDIRDAEARIFVNRILYSPNGISHFDEDLGKSCPGTVDLRKINSSFVDSAAYIEDNQILAAKITVETVEGYIMGEAIYNEAWYYRWEPLAGKRGSGASSEIIERRYVIVYDGDELRGHGMLKIRVLVPNA